MKPEPPRILEGQFSPLTPSAEFLVLFKHLQVSIFVILIRVVSFAGRTRKVEEKEAL